jgi:DNA-binding transcriptional regulator LsrR (DeoR family)
MNDTLIHEIVVRFQGGASIRRIAQSLHISRRTVKRVLDRIEHARGAVGVKDLDGAVSSTPTRTRSPTF